MGAFPPWLLRPRWGYLLAVAGFGALLSTILAARVPLPWPVALPVAGVLAIVHGIVCRSAKYVARTTPRGPSRRVRAIANTVAAALASGGIFLLATLTVVALFGPSSGLPEGEWPFVTGLGAAAYLLSSAYFHVAIARAEASADRARAVEAGLLAREARIEALLARLSPHFLFNALNSIAALTGSDPAAGRTMCLELAGFLRARLEMDGTSLVPLFEELRLARQYLGIERVRFADRLRFEERVEDEALSAPVPPLVLQPLVENAIKHGIIGLESGGIVSIEAAVERGLLVVSIENPTGERGRQEGGRGMGLELVRRRLHAHYGDGASLHVQPSPGRFRVTLRLPLAKEKT
ncbi:MAG: histidine kinase [Deltaproteobacteria bacterium]|nr:histidine kinase [Deltaproteobacteria bacterium]